MSTEASEVGKRKREIADGESSEETLSEKKANSNVTIDEKTESKDESVKAPSPKRSKESGSESETDCISQEDLLAQLGLNSVKKLQTVEPDPNRVIHPEPPKQSILDLLKQPFSKKVMASTAQPDKEKPLSNGSFPEAPEDVENIKSKEKLILRLQNNLRNEEAKLMLLRKLYTCQNEKVQKDTNPIRTMAVSLGTTTQAATSTTANQRKTALAGSSQKPQQQSQQFKTQKNMQKFQQKPKHLPPVLVQKPSNVPAVQPRVVFLSQPRGPSGPQPVIIAPKLLPASDGKRDNHQMKVQMVSPSASKTSSKTNQQSGFTHKPTSSKHLVHIDNSRPAENGLTKSVKKMRSHQSAEQSHAEAKMALRKQLEKTLLEIPLPKPPVQDWNFVPSVNTQDFTILIGLEGVVNHIIESQTMSSKAAKNVVSPKFCSQCDTDFTPGWRVNAKDAAGANEGTLCESCYTQKIKKTLKTEHTTRLKDAFMKALKQEQEVEKKFQLSGVSVSTVGKTSATVKPQAVRVSSTHQPIHASPARIVYHPVHPIPQPQVYQPHHSIVHQLQQQQLQQQHQEIDGPHRQESARYFAYVGQPTPKQRHNYTSDNDRQREYLLDMIPSGHSSRSYRI
ncbi:transcriptional repressor p66 alpha-like [Dendronephthya gigantea]|uniref:transcriptional repressor p66 alpha-like n=1 Tax=Dendronephthya gigantea TaxID=151771 RepID=UPI00106D9EE5|nr:transcriptional repressor p66 alpha-like [Dendronephthya gigantea]XP_028411362.1 transcriptional repressor p66 alpha-like [Dendronephthya gigantea]